MLWTHQLRFLFFNFFLHIKWYAIAMIIEPLCSISNGKRCNTDWQGGVFSLGGPCRKDWKLHSTPYIRILPCHIPHTVCCKPQHACLFHMPRVRIPKLTTAGKIRMASVRLHTWRIIIAITSSTGSNTKLGTRNVILHCWLKKTNQ